MGFDIDNYLPDQSKNNIILFYKGNVDSDVINHVLDTVEDKMVQVNEQAKLRKKVYNVLVESLQNLYHHVDKVPDDYEDQTAEKYGLLIVQKVDSGYRIITGNFVCVDNIEKLEEKIKRINRSSHEEIKELYNRNREEVHPLNRPEKRHGSSNRGGGHRRSPGQAEQSLRQQPLHRTGPGWNGSGTIARKTL
ncbi:MAG: SiaB family protein kinase [Bacteroidales bacterium]